MARRPLHGPLASPAHRERTRQPGFSRGHRMRGRACRRRARRLFRRTRLLGTRPRRRLHLPDEHRASVDRAAGKSPKLVSRRILPSRYHFGISWSRLHHRPARSWHPLRWRHHFLAVMMPAIKFYGQIAGNTPIYPSTIPIPQMTPDDIWRSYIRPMGAGAVAAAGLITLLRTLPTIISALRAGLKDVRTEGAASTSRIDRDVPMRWVIV